MDDPAEETNADRHRGDAWDQQSLIANAVHMDLPRELDRAAVFDCDARFHRALEVADGLIVMHSGDVRFIDSGGLRFLLDSGRRANSAGVRTILAEPSEVLLKLIRLAGLAETIEVTHEPLGELSTAAGRGARDPHHFPVPVQLNR